MLVLFIPYFLGFLTNNFEKKKFLGFVARGFVFFSVVLVINLKQYTPPSYPAVGRGSSQRCCRGFVTVIVTLGRNERKWFHIGSKSILTKYISP